MRTKHRAYEMLNRHFCPSFVAVVGSIFVTLRHGELCWVRYDDGLWVHRYRAGIVVQPRIGGATARMIDKVASEGFAYRYTPRPGDVVFDVGAGVGSESRLFSRLVGEEGRVLAFEANPNTYRCLAKMVALNRLANVIASPYAIADKSGIVMIEDDDTNHLGNSITDDSGSGVEVEARSIDDMAASFDVDHIDMLKMNIEGAELHALQGMDRMLPRTSNVVISCHDFKADSSGLEWQRTVSPVVDLLTKEGFKVERRLDDHRPWIRDTVYGTRVA